MKGGKVQTPQAKPMIWDRLKKNSLAQERLDELDRLEEEQRKVATSIVDPVREQVSAQIHGLNI